jgi:two-component sensor histidine kinase
LDWSKIESDRDTLCRPTAVDIRSVFESILVLLPNKNDDIDIDIMVIIAPNVPKSLMLDETYIHRILMNLLSNALKFTTSSYVMLTLEMDDTHLVATVRDTGAGIPPSFVSQLFDPFSQAQTTGSQRGTGLGLSIVRQLLEKMNGTIKVDTHHVEQGFGPNETGTRFVITIPISSSDLRRSILPPLPVDGMVAVIHPGSNRKLERVLLAWELFGYEVVVMKSIHELSAHPLRTRIQYVWVDSTFLQRNLECIDELITHEEWRVLIPYENQDQLKQLPGLLLGGNIVPVQQPLIWHTFEGHVAVACCSSPSITPSQPMSIVSPINERRTSLKENDISKNVTILLVEDNQVRTGIPTSTSSAAVANLDSR